MEHPFDLLTELNMFEEQALIRDTARNYAQKELKPLAEKIDRQQKLPPEVWARLSELKLTGINISAAHGGMGYNTLCAATAIEEIARVCASTALSLSTHLLMCAAPIMRFGSDEQRKKFLPQLAGGQAVGAFCLTEESAGCDASGIKTQAEQKTGTFVVNGTKKHVVNGAEAGLVLAAIMTDAASGAGGISLLLVEAGAEGVEVQAGAEKMGLRGAEWGEFVFNNAQIPVANLIGAREKGFGIVMEAQLGGRIGLAAIATGLATAALEAAVAHAQRRKQFGKPIGTCQSISNMIADMATHVEASRLMTYRAALRRDEGKSHVRESAMAKLLATEACVKICGDALQILGAAGCERGNPVERFYRSAKMLEIGEGTSQILRLVIARDVLGKL